MYMEVGEINRILGETLNELRFIRVLLQRHGSYRPENSGIGCKTEQIVKDTAGIL